MYAWRYATPEDFIPVCDLFRSSEIANDGGFPEIQRRITIPLLLNHLITFYDNCGKVCGFITFAFMSGDAETHMPTTGINPQDWRSGKNFWAVDFIVRKGCDGYKMLRAVTKGLGVKRAKYFRHKHKQIREVRA